jgi:ketosteroid isomerase-like protein
MIKSKAIHQAILATEKIFMAAYNRHDAPALSALYTTDAEIMPPNTKLVKGPKALRGLFKSFWDAGDVRIKLETVEADGSGQFGYEVGKYTLSGKTGKVNDKGKYIVVWKKVTGKWMLYRDIFNSDKPAA